ncbi:hypothetical protein Acj133p216 [Acinetobacter phage 133]|uniref:Uncharacterized protein n=1 Tax=Acinetobacter phage 133 TaxID=2919552 RepID=D9I6F0_9CAUD|nr:hypothetical protein Acj133p216 [Acinetobacter phage 133]ADJ19531.1 hypothetical protein Acj133p216 [Acinetobacter phage 133]
MTNAHDMFLVATQAKLDALPVNVVQRDYNELMECINEAALNGEFFVHFNGWTSNFNRYSVPGYMWSFNEKLAHPIQAVKDRQDLLRSSMVSLLQKNGFVVNNAIGDTGSTITISWEKG